jgi:hypothetical protein
MGDVVLLGAGASAEAGLPTAFEMTDVISAQLKEALPSYDRSLEVALRYVCEMLGSYGEGSHRLDIERVFSALELLAEREELEITPFVRGWDNGVLQSEEADRLPLLGNVYARLAEHMLSALKALLGTTDSQVEYLRPLVQYAADPAHTTIATLNYDLSIETAGQACGVDIDTGINEWATSGLWRWRDNAAHLLKLHGSINWEWTDDFPWKGRLPSRHVSEFATPTRGWTMPVLVFGLRGKIRAEGPFLSALAEFERQLEQANRLIVIGYSFRDSHINYVIERWVVKGWSRQLVLVDPYLPGASPKISSGMSFRDRLLHYLEDESSESPQTQLHIARAPASVALRTLYP